MLFIINKHNGHSIVLYVEKLEVAVKITLLEVLLSLDLKDIWKTRHLRRIVENFHDQMSFKDITYFP